MVGMKIKPFSQQSLWRQYLIASFSIFLIFTLLIGSWVSSKIENSVAHRLGGITALYVENVIAHHLQSVAGDAELTAADRTALQAILTGTPLGKKIVSFKVWDRRGTVLYSKDSSIIGMSFPIEEGLADAYAGNIHSEISELSSAENAHENLGWKRLIETYVPIREAGADRVIAVAEFYQTTEELAREASLAQAQSWVIVAAAFLGVYLLLAGLVRRGSNTITRQRRELERQIGMLTELNAQNRALHERVRRAAARVTSLNENFLRRISSDLHDGPGQDLGFALMQIESIADGCPACPKRQAGFSVGVGDFQTVYRSLKSALTELRSISAGLRMPDIINLPFAEVVERAVRDYEAKSGATVRLCASEGAAEEPLEQEGALPVKITLYRVLQESLANGFRHAAGAGQEVRVAQSAQTIDVRISDTGTGFQPSCALGDRHLGLKGMRERVEILGGTFHIASSAAGTVICATLPTTVPGMDHA